LVAGSVLLAASLASGQWVETTVLLPDSFGGMPFPQCVAYDLANNTVYVGGGAGRVIAVDGTSNQRVAGINTGAYTDAMCVNPLDNKVYCASSYPNDSCVTIINAATNQVLASVPDGGQPFALCYNSQSDKIYCANSSGGVTVIDGATDSVLATVAAGANPRAICYNPQSNKLYCANYRDSVTVIDGEGDSVLATVIVSDAPSDLCYNPQGNKVYCANEGDSSITVLAGAGDSVLANIRTHSSARMLCYNSANNKMYCAVDAGVVVIDCVADSVLTSIPAAGSVGALCYNPEDNKIYCASVRDTTVVVIDGASDSVVGIFGSASAADSLNCRLVGRYDLYYGTCVALSGNRAYVSNGYSSLYILDVSDPTAPFELGRLDAIQYLRCVAVWGDLVCLGGDSTYSGFLWIVDVSDPGEPYAVGDYTFPSGVHVQGDIVLSGDYAYVPAGGNGLRILRMKPQAPYELGYWDGPGRTCGVALAGNLAYVTGHNSGLQILDVSDPRAPYELGRCSLPGFIYGVAVSGDFAYVAGLDVGGKLRVIDVSNPQAPYQAGWAGFPGTANGVAVSGEFVYVVSRQGLYVIDVSDPPNPHLVGWYVNVSGYGGLVVSGGLAYTPGLDILEFLGEGVAETPNAEVRTTEYLPTVVLGALLLPEAPGAKAQAASLMDISGKRILDLRPGANDVRALAPGVYFVREGGDRREQGGAGIRKVVVTR